MTKLVLLLLFLCSSALAYVPTVESLFRHGANPEVSANGLTVTLVVRKIQPGMRPVTQSDVALLSETKEQDFYKFYFTKLNNDILKVSQTRYENKTFNEASLLEKVYYPNFTAYTIKATPEESEKGIFMGLMKAMLFNDGSSLINYLKALGVPVRLNSEILNREKIELMAEYKKYLAAINKDRNAKKTEINPLRPDDSASRERADKIMSEPMYLDMKQVRLARDDGEMAWVVSAGSFEASMSYKRREVQRVKYKSSLGEMEIICKDYWLANGTHALPRYMLVKDYKGETYQVEITNLRHYVEKETDLMNRLKKWDSILKGKESLDPKPAFML